MKFITTIEARYDSSRLKGKVLNKLYKNITTLDMLYKNIQKSKYVKKILIVTGENKNNKKIINFAKKKKILLYQGSELNVLQRLYYGTKSKKEKYLIQLTGDNPLIDYNIIDYIVEKFEKYYPKFDYVTNNNLFNKKKNGFPTGMIVSVFKKKLLNDAFRYQRESGKSDLAEHPSLYFYREGRKMGKINCLNVKVPKKWAEIPKIRLTLDHKKDLFVLKKICNHFEKNKKDYRLEDIKSFLKKNIKIKNYNINIVQKNPKI